MSQAQSISDQDFEQAVLKSEKPVLVDFWAEWCGPCRMLGPIVEEIARERSEKLTVAKMNVDDSPATAARFQITSIPTLILFQNGQPVKTIVGAKPKAALEADLADFIA